MKWHKVVFDNEQISAGELREFQDDCIELYRAFYSPKGMVLLINDRPTDSKLGMETTVYFSPGCLLYAQPLISHYSGEPYEQTDMKDVVVFLGNPDEIESHQ